MTVFFMIAAVSVCLLAAVVLRMRWENRHFTITEYTIADARFACNEKPVKLVVAADLHNREYGAKNETLLRAIDGIHPDAVLLAGDMTVGKPGRSTAPAVRFVCALAARYPVYYGVGNHEYRMRIYPETYGTAYEEYDAALASAGVSMLHNERRPLMLGKTEADVFGLEMDRDYYKRLCKITMEPEYLDETLPEKRDGVYRILLAHDPDYFDAYAAWGADIVCAGHVHGGLIRLCGRGLLSPRTGLFPKYDGGEYKKGSARMFVSRGLGAHTLPLRLFNVPELLVLNLTGAAEDDIFNGS